MRVESGERIYGAVGKNCDHLARRQATVKAQPEQPPSQLCHCPPEYRQLSAEASKTLVRNSRKNNTKENNDNYQRPKINRQLVDATANKGSAAPETRGISVQVPVAHIEA